MSVYKSKVGHKTDQAKLQHILVHTKARTGDRPGGAWRLPPLGSVTNWCVNEDWVCGQLGWTRSNIRLREKCDCGWIRLGSCIHQYVPLWESGPPHTRVKSEVNTGKGT